MLDSPSGAGGHPRAFLRVGGLTVARQQAALALQLECERVICIAIGLSPELIEVQHQIEAGGAQFHLVGQPRALLGLVSAVDEIVVLADGLFASPSAAANLLAEGQAILVQPIEQGLAAGFERIDLNHAAGGIMRLPGRLMERVAELPPDCDVASALLRIALQAGIRQKPIPAPGQNGVFWTLVRSEEEAHAIEPLWIRQRTRGEGALSPSNGLALLGVRSFGPALLHAGRGGRVLATAAAANLLMALGAGWFGLAALGLGLCALGWVLFQSAQMLSRIESDFTLPRKRLELSGLFGWATDIVLILLAAWSLQQDSGHNLADALFAPFILVAMLRILPRLAGPRWAPWFNDRALLAAVLIAASLAGLGDMAIRIAASLAALAGILLPIGQKQLTRY